MSRPGGRALVAILATALALRLLVGALEVSGWAPLGETRGWWWRGYNHLGRMAVDLVEGRGFHLTGRPAPRPPLYPLILAGEYLVAGRSDLLPLLVQAAMGTATALLAYLIGRRLFSRPA